MSDNEYRSYEYASVYLLDNPYGIDTTYDYFIPFELRADVCRGAFVTVPFGRGNRKHMALVDRLCRAPSVQNVKPVVAVCKDRAALSEEIIRLCLYMKEQILCTVGDAVRCAVPSAILGKLSEYYYPAPGRQPDGSAGFSPADLFVYNYIESRPYVGIDTLKSKFGASAALTSIKKLVEKGYVCKELKAGEACAGAYEFYYRAVCDADKFRRIIDKSADVKISSEKQKEVLGLLVESSKEMSAKEIMQLTGATAAQIKALVDKGLVSKNAKRKFRESFYGIPDEKISITLNSEQETAFEEIKKSIHAGKAEAALLFGVTGSGKTNVMMKAIEECVNNGRGVILLLPEIALTPQTVGKFYAYFGDRVVLVHSGLSAGERQDAYERITSGEADIVIGTRSAVFSPVKNPGLFIIDEEHESTYKSETSPKYHARDIVRWRCAYNGAVMLLSSATPSVESYTKAVEGKYKLLRLKSRYGNATLPEVVINDMRNEDALRRSPLSARLVSELKRVTDEGDQAILFLNRRGYNTVVSCKSCGEVITCPHCSISLNYHTVSGRYDRGFLFCHWCGYKAQLPEKCPNCSSEHLVKVGFGTQKIEQELSELLPGKKILRMDADSTGKKQSYEKMLSQFKNREADVLIGTQMVTKGHDFPGVTLVGVLLADMSLYLDDYHANERTFAMLTQVIGRAGRSEKKGMAIIQTNNPDNDVIKLACRQDYESFYDSEIRLRKLLVFPPYCDIALLNIISPDEKQTALTAKRLREEIDIMLKTNFSDVSMIVFGPFEAPVYKVEEKYRMRIVIKCRLNKRSREMFSQMLIKFGREGAGKSAVSVDFNPTGL